ncbi:MAG: SigF/SigG family RNA polymerase sporulation sigma factor [Clostridia bacterium]|nr:SigF/SigG family RNA polymerase sporulation sigma factor [Clostridia bacterium]
MTFTNDELLKNAKDGDKEALNIIVQNNSGLVWSIVRRFLNRGYEKEDLYQIGCIGLIKAVKKFDFNYNTQFSTYAVPVIMGEIKKFLRDDGLIKVSRALKETAAKIKMATELYFGKHGVEPSIKELSKHLKISEEEIVMAQEALRPTESLNAVVNEDDKNPVYLLDKINDGSFDAEKEIEKIELKSLIKDLGPRERQLIAMRYFRGQTQSTVADVLGISQVQVSRMEKRILENMRRSI